MKTNSKNFYKSFNKKKSYYKKPDCIIKKNNFVKALSIFKTHKKNSIEAYNWQNKWHSYHLQYKSVLIHKLIAKFFLKYGLYINKFCFRINHSGIQLFGTSYGVFRVHKAKKRHLHYAYKCGNKNELSNIGNFILSSYKAHYVKIKFYHIYLPRKLLGKESIKVFKKHKRERFFWESLQIINAVFKGYASASILGGLMYTHTRRNPKRIGFVAYIKRLLDWHFRSISHCKIQGVRIEVKGRFNAKSRAKKRIISAGRVRMHEKSSKVDFAFIEAFTKFGSLGIKVWVCPKSY